MDFSIDITTATFADVFAHLLEAQGHAGLDPNKRSDEWGNALFPHVQCQVSWPHRTSRYRGNCPECIALRKYRLDQGETEEDQEQRWNLRNVGTGLQIKIGES